MSKLYASPRYYGYNRNKLFPVKERSIYRRANDAFEKSFGKQRKGSIPKKFKGYGKRLINFIKQYFEESSLHGMAYIVKKAITYIERILWALLVILAIAFSFYFNIISIEKFKYKSTYIGLERDYYYLNTTLPSVTICPMTRLTEERFNVYVEKFKLTDPEKEELFDFLHSMANATFLNFENIRGSETIDRLLKQLGITPEKYMELIYNLTDNNLIPIDGEKPAGAFEGSYVIHSRMILTEYGLCYMANSYINDKYSARFMLFGQYPEQYEPKEGEKLVRVQIGGFFDKDVTIILSGIKSQAIDSFVHSAYEVMKVDSNFGYSTLPLSYTILSTETIAEEDFQLSSTISQRNCRFHDESNLTHFPVYTRNLCVQECRLNLAMKLCGCIPHFYPNRVKKPKPVCDYRKLIECFPQHASFLLKLYDEKKDNKPIDCYCMHNCVDALIAFTKAVQVTGSLQLLNGPATDATIRSWARFRLKRQIIFTFTDLLVAIGGAAGLCVGFSVLAAIELIYYFTLRFIWWLRGFNL